LGLHDHRLYGADTDFLPSEVYEHGLTEEQNCQWDTLLGEAGLIPYIEYPVICQKCGKLWPLLFMVPDEEWEYYIQPDMRNKVICRECLDFIEQVIDGGKFAASIRAKEEALYEQR
jgi:hypothetical protein